MACDEAVIAEIITKHMDALVTEAQERDICAMCLLTSLLSAINYSTLVRCNQGGNLHMALEVFNDAMTIAQVKFEQMPDPSVRGNTGKNNLH